MKAEKITLLKGSVIFSPYELNEPKLKKVVSFQPKNVSGEKYINLYSAESNLELNIKDELAKLDNPLQ